MTRNFGVLASVLLTLGFVGYACTSGEVVDGPPPAERRARATPGTGGRGQHGRRRHHRRRQHAAPAQHRRQRHRPRRHHRHRQHHRHQPAAAAPPAPATPPAPRAAAAPPAPATPTGTPAPPAPATPPARPAPPGTAGSTGACPPSFAVSADGFVQMPARADAGLATRSPTRTLRNDGDACADVDAAGSSMMLKMTGSISPVERHEVLVRGHGLQSRPDPGRGTRTRR